MKHFKISIIITLVILIVMPSILHAQPMPDSNDVDTPIDGGISLLVVAGAAIGAKKIRDARRKK